MLKIFPWPGRQEFECSKLVTIYYVPPAPCVTLAGFPVRAAGLVSSFDFDFAERVALRRRDHCVNLERLTCNW